VGGVAGGGIYIAKNDGDRKDRELPVLVLIRYNWCCSLRQDLDGRGQANEGVTA